MAKPDVTLVDMDDRGSISACMGAAKTADPSWSRALRNQVLGELSDAARSGWTVFIAKVADHFTIV